jgi:flagellar L-ring protein FlgH
MNKDHPLSRPIGCLLSAISSLLLSCCGAMAQNLVMLPPQPAAPTAPGTASPTAPPDAPTPPAPIASQPGGAAPAMGYRTASSASDQLQGVSLFVVSAPPPKKFAKHDVVEVIINESSAEKITQTTDMKKDYSLKSELSHFPSLEALFTQLALREGIGSVHPQLGVTSNKELKGDGKLDRKDEMTAKLSAFVVDVKPNGNLVLEARESRSSGKEVTTMVLAGTCRAEDITKNNTIQSAQLAGLTIRVEHEGDVKDTGSKGFIPQILEAVFNF